MKDTIIKAAQDEIRLKSLSFTMDDLVRRLGISKKTIYQHISSKEEIIGEILLRMKKDMERKQIELFNDKNISTVDKMKGLLKISPTNDELITPITLNQLKRSFPRLYTKVNDIYHFSWDRFNAVYADGLEKGEVNPFDVEFFKELYITAVTNLFEVPSMSKYSYSQIVEKTVEQLFNGVEK